MTDQNNAAQAAEQEIEAIMEQAQVFASAWAFLGGPFDNGSGLEQAERERSNLRALLSKLRAEGVQAGEQFGRAEISFPMMVPGNRVYLAGPMTGIDGHNFPAFNAAAERLRGFGLEVVNPADHGVVDGMGWSDYMRWDIVKLAGCHSVYVLPGWEKSKGASLEVSIARALGMLVFTVDGAPLASAPVAGEAHMPPGYRVKAVDGHGYRITPPTGSDWVAHSDTPAGDLIAALVAAPKASEAVRLDAPAQVGGVRFGKGIHWSTVISAAQRHHAFMNTPEKEAERIARAKEFVESIQADKDGECKPCNGMGFIDGVGDRCQACNGDGGDCAKGAGDIWPEAVRLLRVFAQDLAGCNADAKQAAELLAGIDAAPTPVADSLERDYRARKWPPAPGVYQVERTLELSAQPGAQLKGERDA